MLQRYGAPNGLVAGHELGSKFRNPWHRRVAAISPKPEPPPVSPKTIRPETSDSSLTLRLTLKKFSEVFLGTPAN